MTDTLLHLSIKRGFFDVAEFIILRHPDLIHKSNDQGDLPLHCAARIGSLAIVKLLLSVGADPHLLNDMEQSPLYVANDHGFLEIVSVLMDDSCDKDLLLFCAITRGYSHLVEYFLDKNFPVDRSEPFNITPLVQAVRQNHIDCAKVLLKAGANPNQRGHSGDGIHSLLYIAIENRNMDLVDLLLSYNLDPKLSNDALVRAVFVNHKEFVIKLLAYGFDPNSCLHMAVNNNNIDIVRLLLEAGANYNVLDYHNCTPKEIAIQKELVNIVSLFETFEAMIITKPAK